MRVRVAQLFNGVLPEVFLKSRSHSAAGSLASKKTMEWQSWIMPLMPVTWLDQFESELGASVNSAKEVQGPLVGVVLCILSWNFLIATVHLQLSGKLWEKGRHLAFSDSDAQGNE